MKSKKTVWAEMARRKVQFFPDAEWDKITLWGLFEWGSVSRLIKNGELLTNMVKENKIVWVKPTEKTWLEEIKPLIEKHTLDELTDMAGWKDWR